MRAKTEVLSVFNGNRMKQLIILFSLLCSIDALGQDHEDTKSLSGSRWIQVGVNLSPNYCYRSLQNNDGSSIGSSIIALRNNNEKAKFGYTAGLDLRYNFSKHIAIETGIQYSNTGYQYDIFASVLTFSDPIDPRYGFVYPGTGVSLPEKFVYNYFYLDIPVRFIFIAGEKKIRFSGSVGLITDIFLKATVTSVGGTSRITYDEPYAYKPINISPMISLGFDYRISNKINVSAEPTFRYGLLKIIDEPVTGYLWNAGLNLTCYYSLR